MRFRRYGHSTDQERSDRYTCYREMSLLIAYRQEAWRQSEALMSLRSKTSKIQLMLQDR